MPYAVVLNGRIRQVVPTREDIDMSPADKAAGAVVMRVGIGAGVGERAPKVEVTEDNEHKLGG